MGKCTYRVPLALLLSNRFLIQLMVMFSSWFETLKLIMFSQWFMTVFIISFVFALVASLVWDTKLTWVSDFVAIRYLWRSH